MNQPIPSPEGIWSAEQCEQFAQDCFDWLGDRQSQLIEQFNLGSYDRYDFDLTEEKIQFSDAAGVKVVARIIDVGSFASEKGTWMWAWGNSSVPAPLARKLLPVREFGERHGIVLLTDVYLEEVDDFLCYTMTAVAAYILEGQGMYRAPRGDSFFYFVLKDVRWA